MLCKNHEAAKTSEHQRDISADLRRSVLEVRKSPRGPVQRFVRLLEGSLRLTQLISSHAAELDGGVSTPWRSDRAIPSPIAARASGVKEMSVSIPSRVSPARSALIGSPVRWLAHAGQLRGPLCARTEKWGSHGRQQRLE